MVKEFKMSQERYDELKAELDYSKTTRADEIAELIKEARGFGDLSENSEYDEAKNEQASSTPALLSWRRFCSTPRSSMSPKLIPIKFPSAARSRLPTFPPAKSCPSTRSSVPRRRT